MTNDEINLKVALKLGYVRWDAGFVNKDKGPLMHTPNFSTSISSAWEIVEFMRKDSYVQIDSGTNDDWRVIVSTDETHADTAPMAICLAFLKLEK